MDRWGLMRAARLLVPLLVLPLAFPAFVGADGSRCPEGNPDLCFDPILIQRERALVGDWYGRVFLAPMDGPRVLTPPPGTSVPVGGMIAAAAYLPDDGRTFVRMHAGPAGGPLELVGEDHDSWTATEGPGCLDPAACSTRGIWQFAWDVGPEAPGYLVVFEAVDTFDQRAHVFAQALYTPDVAPTIVFPRNGQSVGLATPLLASASAASTVEIAWSYYPLPLYPLGTVGKPDGSKGLPLKDQHKEGDTLSGDTDGNGSKGDMSCAPTAAASSLAWFAKSYPERYGALMEWTGATGPTGGGTMTNKDLVAVLGHLAGTSDLGTAPDSLAAAIQAWLDYKLGSGKMKATYADGVVDLPEAAKEFNRGQDVLLGLYWSAGGAHRVAVNNIVANGDGSYDVTIMDPWNGTYQKMRVGADGKTDYGGGASVQRMIHVSPVEAAPKPTTAIPSGPHPTPVPFDGTVWAAPGEGEAMIVATALTGDMLAGYAHALVRVEAASLQALEARSNVLPGSGR